MTSSVPHLLADQVFGTSHLVEVRTSVASAVLCRRNFQHMQILVQGLVREFLTRSALSSTLKEFDREKVS